MEKWEQRHEINNNKRCKKTINHVFNYGYIRPSHCKSYNDPSGSIFGKDDMSRSMVTHCCW